MYNKSLVSFIVIFTILVISFNVMAEEQSEVDLDLNIGPYAELEIVNDYYTDGDIIDFGELSGEPGVYYIDGTGLATAPGGLEAAYTDNNNWAALEPQQVQGHGYGGYFNVKTNTDIDIEFNWLPDENLVSPMYFALYSPETSSYVHKFGSGNLQDSNGDDIGSTTYYSQGAGTNKQWHIDAAIYITEVHEQVAGEYNGVIEVTIQDGS